MASLKDRREHPISMRFPAGDVDLIDRAAALRGRSRTDFVREAAVRAAEDILMEARLIRMSEDSFADFVAALSAPAQFVPEIAEVLARPAPWEASDDPEN